MNKIFKVGLIGCGHISETYFRAEKYFNNIKIIKCADINHGNAVRCAKTYKIQALTVNELLKDKEIGEDEEKSSEKSVQAITDNHIKSVDEKVSLKEKEIMTI